MRSNLTPNQLAHQNLILKDNLLNHQGQLKLKEITNYIDLFIKCINQSTLNQEYDYKNAELVYDRIRSIPELCSLVKDPLNLMMVMYTLPILEEFYIKDDGYQYDRESIQNDILHAFTQLLCKKQLEQILYKGCDNQKIFIHDKFENYYDQIIETVNAKERRHQIQLSMDNKMVTAASNQGSKKVFPFEAYSECAKQLTENEIYRLTERVPLNDILSLDKQERQRIIGNIIAFRKTNFNQFSSFNPFLDGIIALVGFHWLELSKFASLSTEQQIFIALHHTEYQLTGKHLGMEAVENIPFDKLKTILLSLVEDESNNYANEKRAELEFHKNDSVESEKFRLEVNELLNNRKSLNI